MFYIIQCNPISSNLLGVGKKVQANRDSRKPSFDIEKIYFHYATSRWVTVNK